MARLLRPVMKIRSVIPAAAASSTAYWISGLSTTGSISLGLALVTGRKRVPSPATGKTALVTLAIAIDVLARALAAFGKTECAREGDRARSASVRRDHRSTRPR